MIVSWNWLKDYVDLKLNPEQLVERLAMSGLNHEQTVPAGDDLAIDLEVTSNRPDCLGHIGVAREIAVLFDLPLRIPPASLRPQGPPIRDLTSVTIECPDLCPRYTARLIRGVKVAASPAWLAARLEAVGIAVINNIVDITNYVMLESGQPLHAFDFKLLRGPRIIVRRARQQEELVAIDHRAYKLDPDMCVIADAERAVALGGVMGGEDSEVSTSTTEVLIEAAEFSPLSIRATARQLNLHSPSSYRFERGLDPEGVDWASRRCCELILELAGGELADDVLDVGGHVTTRQAITLRLPQLKRVLGIEIRGEEVLRILRALGGQQAQLRDSHVGVVPPSWRRDLTREIDLIEEVARIHGYDKIPEDVGVPMAPSHRRERDRVVSHVRQVLTALGFDEAMTASVVPAEWAGAFDGWTREKPLQTQMAMLRGADSLRQSLLPSLLEAARVNQSLGNEDVELFETAHIYLPRPGQLPREQSTLALVSHADFGRLKGAVEAMLDALHAQPTLEVEDVDVKLLAPPRSCRLRLGDQLLGFVGELSRDALKRFGLRDRTAVAELDVAVLQAVAELVPQHREQSPYPAMTRDLNLIVDESLRWAELAEVVRTAAGELLEELRFLEIYRDPQKDGPGKKRLLFTMTFRSDQRTLTGPEVDDIRDRVVAACGKAHQAVLL